MAAQVGTDEHAPRPSDRLLGPGRLRLGLDAELFYPERGASTRAAKAVCRSCPVRPECLDYAIATNQKFGLWGGMSERERRRARKARRLTLVTTMTNGEEPMSTVAATDQQRATAEPAAVTAASEPTPDPPSVPAPPAPSQPARLGPRACNRCGTTYRPVRTDQRYCSPDCRKQVAADAQRQRNGRNPTRGPAPGPHPPRILRPATRTGCRPDRHRRPALDGHPDAHLPHPGGPRSDHHHHLGHPHHAGHPPMTGPS